MSSYEALAGAYDGLMQDGLHRKRADYLLRQFRKSGLEIRSVLDLACGTGTIACMLAEEGYIVTATDGSEEMLTEAARKAADLELDQPPFFLHQSMPRLRLAEPVDAVISTVDSLNYLTRPGDVQETFRRVGKYLKPGGLFIFDVNSPYKFENIYGNNAYILEGEHDDGGQIFCGWQNEYDRESGICDFYLSVFEEGEDGAYFRADEQQRERCYDLDSLKRILKVSGFEFVGVYADFDFSAPVEETERFYIVARAKK